MKVSFVQKIKLAVVLILLWFFVVLDKIGVFVSSAFIYMARFLALFFVLCTFLAFTTKMVVKPGEMFDSFFYYPFYSSSGLTIRQNLPKKLQETSLPLITAESAIAIDVKTNKILYDLNSSKLLPPASTTKVMTILTAKSMYRPDELIPVPTECTQINGQKAGFFPDEVVSVQDLYYALLLSSGGDAACTLASKNSANFVGSMNNNAKIWSLKNTRFSNVIGFDGTDIDQVTTAYDLSQLGKIAMQDELIRTIAGTKTYITTSTLTPHFLTNTNRMLWDIPESVGLKTGTTDGAGEVLLYDYKDANKDIIIVVIRSSDRFGDTKKILDWVLANYSWEI